ncbi:MAG: hypothetical protein FJ301_06710 [Planctomycetes bacterium]|nr:hypothetical protein [Planctomycetota bacterium]
MKDLTEILVEHVRQVCASRASFSDEEEFHAAMSQQLGHCSNKVRVAFAPARLPAKRPFPPDIQECSRKGKMLAPEGKDPCGGRRVALDIHWKTDGESVPIELKYRPHWNSDVYGYAFLKDLHRLERLPDMEWAPHRYAVFLTPVDDYWSSSATREPKPFRLTHGHRTPARYWVQYDQPSAATRWFDYPPFFLWHPYEFTWHDIRNAGRCLVVRVRSQSNDA